jgi:hypothetical protein
MSPALLSSGRCRLTRPSTRFPPFTSDGYPDVDRRIEPASPGRTTRYLEALLRTVPVASRVLC